ncbi:MAG: ComF family protein [Prochlorococcus sp.]|nr:ComF family protein [Prochlorococcaceae cyanobacterium Fu_MAG_50]
MVGSLIGSLIQAGRELLLLPQCPVCSASVSSHAQTSIACKACQQRFSLAENGLQGLSPLPWRGLGFYAGDFRRLLLSLRKRDDQRAIRALSRQLKSLVTKQALLIPIPSWKSKARANSTPLIMGSAMGLPCFNLLRRTRPTLGQHSLSQPLRQSNQHNSFEACPDNQAIRIDWRQHQAWIVDDILTTGATALAARTALRKLAIPVAGMICLARTPTKANVNASKTGSQRET